MAKHPPGSRSDSKQLPEDRFFVFSRRATFAVFAILVALLVIDLLSSRQAILKFDDNLETLYLALTAVIGWGIGSWLLLGYIGGVTAGIRSRSFSIRFLHRLVIVAQFALLAVLLFVLFNRSTEFLTQYVYAISSILAVAIMVVFSVKLFSWYRVRRRGDTSIKDRLILLFFALAATGIGLSVATDYFSKAVLVQVIQEETPPGATLGQTFPFKDFEQGRILSQDAGPETTITYLVPNHYVEAYHLLGLIPPYFSFFFRWGATSIALRQYYRLMGTVTFWLLVSIPLILYGIGKIPDFFDAQDELWQRIIYRTGSIGGNIMFGICFFMMGTKLNPPVRDYLIICGMGFTIAGMAFGISGLQQTFGVAGHSLVLLSAYLFVMGLYSTAVSTSHDSRLRKFIRRSASEELKLVDKMGQAQMEQEMQKKLVAVAKINSTSMIEQSGIRSSLEDAEIKRYVNQVLEEIKTGDQSDSLPPKGRRSRTGETA